MTAFIVPAVAAPLVPDPWMALGLFGIAVFFTSFPSGCSATAITETTPARLRGQVSATYYLSMSAVGLMAGPLSVALLTDRLFVDPHAVARSLSLVEAVVAPLGALLVWRALPAFRGALAAADVTQA
jgi:MFS transporter, Spinster family, sphingosine-1-phosphate transporter